MAHYIAILEEEEGKAVGVWFPDLRGCFSAGDSLDEAMLNAQEALQLWAEVTIENGGSVPPPRSLAQLKADPDVAKEIAAYVVAIVPLVPRHARSAAE